MIKQEKQAEKDTLKEKKDAYDDLIDKRIEDLEKLKESEDYKKSLLKISLKPRQIFKRLARHSQGCCQSLHAPGNSKFALQRPWARSVDLLI